MYTLHEKSSHFQELAYMMIAGFGAGLEFQTSLLTAQAAAKLRDIASIASVSWLKHRSRISLQPVHDEIFHGMGSRSLAGVGSAPGRRGAAAAQAVNGKRAQEHGQDSRAVRA